jgi:hypothetical protein
VKIRHGLCAAVCVFIGVAATRADEVQMQNGDRYFGKVVSMSADTVLLNSEMLGQIKVPRKLVSSLSFGTNPPPVVSNLAAASLAAPVTGPTNALILTGPVKPATPLGIPVVPGTNAAPADFASAFQRLGSNTNFVAQIRDQMLAGNPQATAKFDTMVSGLMDGSLSVSDLRQQAKSSADQIRALKQQLGPDADSSLDGYLQILDEFVKQTDDTK